MLRLAVLSAAVLWSSSALALSCLPHELPAVFRDAQDSEDRFLVVLGRMTFDEALMPRTDFEDQASTPPETRIPARLEGRVLSHAGFVHPYAAEVTLNAQCYGPWCAGAESGTDYIAFVNLDRDPPEVAINPCGGHAFPDPTPEMQAQAVACLNGGACEPKLGR